VSKFLFCLQVSNGFTALLSLLKNAKAFSRFYKTASGPSQIEKQLPLKYDLTFKGVKRQVYLRTYSGDFQMFFEIMWENVYQLNAIKLADKPVIVDAGAHIGMSSLYFIIHYKPAVVYAIEPDTLNIQLFRMNLSEELASGKVKLFESALYNKIGEGMLQSSRWSYNSQLTIDNKNSRKVRTDTMQHLIEENKITRIDLLKLDIEGAETEVFRSDTGWLACVENIIIEIHAENDRYFIEDIMKSYGLILRKWNRNMFSNVYLATRQTS
jgi:FkbM family methyltransferase